MHAIAMDVDALEGSMLDLNDQSSVIGTAFEMVQNGIQTVFCKDCCGCNDTGCAPA